MLRTVLLFFLISCSGKPVLSQSKVTKERAIKIAKAYDQAEVGCGGISEKVTETKKFWNFIGYFGFAGVEKLVQIDKETGAVYVDQKLEVKDPSTLNL